MNTVLVILLAVLLSINGVVSAVRRNDVAVALSLIGLVMLLPQIVAVAR